MTREGSSFEPTQDAEAVRALYRQILDGWNRRDGAAFAEPFDQNGTVIGFDGSQHVGRALIESDLQKIFTSHDTPTYVGKVKSVCQLTPEVYMLHAIAGMVPPGRSDLDPRLNAVQVLLVIKRSSTWRVVSFQNTPAQFHGRPELVREMTEELQQLL